MNHSVIKTFCYSKLIIPVNHNCLNHEFITYFIEECTNVAISWKNLATPTRPNPMGQPLEFPPTIAGA